MWFGLNWAHLALEWIHCLHHVLCSGHTKLSRSSNCFFFLLETGLKNYIENKTNYHLSSSSLCTAYTCPILPLLGFFLAGHSLYFEYEKLSLFESSLRCVQDFPGLDCGVVRGSRLLQERGHWGQSQRSTAAAHGLQVVGECAEWN